MKLILTTEVENLGVSGDIVEVKDGYGRNYLLPQHKAIKWTRGAASQIEGLKRARDAREIRGVDHAKEIAAQLAEIKCVIAMPTADGGKLFGAVTPADIATAVKASGGPAIDKRQITVSKPIKTTGTHTVEVALHQAVTAHLKVNVQAS